MVRLLNLVFSNMFATVLNQCSSTREIFLVYQYFGPVVLQIFYAITIFYLFTPHGSVDEVYFDLRFVSEDEIDVVTIEKPVKRKSPAPSSNVNNNNNVVTKTSREDEPAAKRPRMNQKRPRESSNKEGKETTSSDTDYEPSTRLSGKEKFEESDCKRNVHNVLERKRRNDLKYSFQVLRDSIPDLKGSERAPKVAILRKATDCILNLRSEQERLLEQKSFLEKKRQSLLQKLKALKESS